MTNKSQRKRSRWPLTVLFGTMLLLNCWWWMQIVHELGHAPTALATGAQVRRFLIPTFSISETDVAEHGAMLWILWAGPLTGVLVPLTLWAVARWAQWRFWPELRFFAGFCLIANGAYLSFGSLEGIGDAGSLLREGAAPWSLWGWGLVCIPTGLALWHGLGRHFSMNRDSTAIESRPIAPSRWWAQTTLLLATPVLQLAAFLLSR